MQARFSSFLSLLLLSSCGFISGIEEVTHDPALDAAGAAGTAPGPGGGGPGPGGGGKGGGGPGGGGPGGQGGAGQGGAGEGGAGQAGAGEGGAGQGGAGEGGAGQAGAGEGGAGTGGAGEGGAGQGGAGASGQGGGGPVPCQNEALAVYVKAGPAGGDGTKSAPFGTLSGAIASAEAGKEICVCKGSYAEDAGLKVDKKLSIFGAFDCGTWKRDEGALSGSLANGTTLTAAAAEMSSEGAGLLFSKDAGGSRIEGMTIQLSKRGGLGPDGLGNSALRVNDAAVTIERCVIEGPSVGQSTGVSNGLLLVRSSAEVRYSKITGGSGDLVSRGVMIRGGSPSLRGNLISAGQGKAPCKLKDGIEFSYRWSAAGVWLDTSKPGEQGQASLEHNLIDGGVSERTEGCPYTGAGVGVDEQGGKLNVTLRDNVIRAGSSGSAGILSGINASLSGSLVLAQNRVFGGIATASSSGSVGVMVPKVGSLRLENSMIHGGNGSGLPTTAAALGEVSQEGAAEVFHNTLFAGSSGKKAVALQIGLGSVEAGPAENKLRIVNNYLFTPTATSASGLLFQGGACAKAVQGQSNSNIFIQDASIIDAAAPCAGDAVKNDAASAASALGATGWWFVYEGGKCKNDGSINCISLPCMNASECVSRLFKDWGTDFGAGTLVGSDWSEPAYEPFQVGQRGWQLNLSISDPIMPAMILPTFCALVRSAAQVGGVTKDLWSQARSKTPTPGAEEIPEVLPTGKACQ